MSLFDYLLEDNDAAVDLCGTEPGVSDLLEEVSSAAAPSTFGSTVAEDGMDLLSSALATPGVDLKTNFDVIFFINSYAFDSTIWFHLGCSMDN